MGNKVEENHGGAIQEYVSQFGVSAQMVGQTENSAVIDIAGGVQALYANGALARFRFPDWQATIRAESSTARAFTESLAFGPFGERYAVKGAPYNVDSFTGSPDQIVGDEYDFAARELHDGQGRWITPDPMRGTGNKYAYVGNNPLSRVDPMGLYVCQGTKQECTGEQLVIRKDLESKDPDVKAAAKVYGPLSKKAGDKGDNGITVKFGEKGHGGETQLTHDKTGVVVTMNSDVVVNGANAAKNSDADVQARAAVAHEGAHVEDYKADIANKFDAAHDITERQSEHHAYSVTNDVLRESGRSMANGVDLSTPAGIDQFLSAQRPGMNLDVPISTNTEP